MFQPQTRQSGFHSALRMAELIYHATVRNVRKSHGNAVVGLLMAIMQTVIMVAIFWAMFAVLGLRGNAIRGDFMLYVLTGIFLFLTHNKAVTSVMGAEGPTSPMMQHAPMTTLIAISAAALGTLYIQTLALFVVLFGYHVAVTPIEVFDPVRSFGMVVLAWMSGCAVGLLLMALKPWAPSVVSVVAQVYTRANMIASGKMFVANSLPGWMLSMFDWNPLFHCIDQARGFVFLNYNPHYSDALYPVYVSVALLTVGMMLEFYTRKHASLSWGASK